MLRRMLTVFYIMACFGMGFMLLFYPWISPWTNNFFVRHYPWIEALARNDYLRGAVSGVGLADIGLAAYETGRLRRHKRAVETTPGITT
jgi:hypothetical protein